MSRLLAFVVPSVFVLVASPVLGQQQGGQAPETQISDSVERIGENHVRRVGRVELHFAETSIFADQADVYDDEHKAVLVGNVVLSQSTGRIAAERAEFDTETRLGTFYKAWGIASVQPPRQTARTGFQPAQVVGEETDVYFYGDTVQKIGPKKYKITNGGFTTCVQPTPRWQLTSKTVVLNVDHYTLLRQAVFSVKGVPMLYTPILYYPTKRDDRATGFLIPTYGTSTIRGQAVHNAFFWAINRSHDATIMHDWFSTAGQGIGSEYRYNVGAGDGNISTHWLNQHATTIESDGTTSTVAESRSYEIRGSVNQTLPYGFRARGRVNYFSNLETMQTFNTNIYDASRNQRNFGGNIVGVTHGFSINGTFDHSEYFYSDSSAVTGTWPRLSTSRNERPIFGSIAYYSVTGEYAHLLRTNKSVDGDIDNSVTRFDLLPQIRYPFKKWQWFTVNSTIAWRDTYYTRSLNGDKVVDDGLNRRFFEFRSQLLGPIFTKIWTTPDNRYAEKFKHSIEPFLNLTRTTAIDNFDQIIQLEGIDTIVGKATSYTYGITNRFYAKRRPPVGSTVRASSAREILDIEVLQSYYTDARAAQFDRQYATSFTGAPPNNFSPIALSVRALPTDELNATMRAEFDSRYHALRTISASGTYNIRSRLSATVNWSKRGFIPNLPGFDNKDFLDQYINTSTNLHTADNRIGGIYSFNYDILHSRVLQQRLTGFYNAQCCGVAFEYQTYNLSGISTLAVPVDRRFFMSFTLAGLGNFSPFNGAMSGVPR